MTDEPMELPIICSGSFGGNTCVLLQRRDQIRDAESPAAEATSIHGIHEELIHVCLLP